MSAITARTRADGLAVQLNLDAALPLVFNLIADAFDSDPELVGGLLLDLAHTRRRLRRAQEDAELRDVPDAAANSLGGQVDRLHEDLEEQLAEHLTVELSPEDVVRLQSALAHANQQTFFGRLGRAS